MNWWLRHNFDKKRENVIARSRVIKALRTYFDDRDFIEVDTPALQICPVMDAHIHAFETVYKPMDKSGDKVLYLQTSPEFDMKKLLSAGMERIYQVAHVYRNGESTSRHSPEFMLLEWYRTGVDYEVLMDDCEELLRSVSSSVSAKVFQYKDKVCDPFAESQKISVVEAFEKYADIDLSCVLSDRDGFADEAREKGIRVCDSDAWDDIFHAVMAEKIEPFLGIGTPSILYDYPISMAALSRKKKSDPRFAERFELYVCGVELANAFSELTDADEQRTRYHEEMLTKKKLYGEVYPADEEFFSALEYMPESAGIALGVDRLVMLVCGVDTIDQVQWAELNFH
ncbi:MAG: EF-P lysine aminoacylase EpmA [Alphaproteobacteria bacterium]